MDTGTTHKKKSMFKLWSSIYSVEYQLHLSCIVCFQIIQVEQIKLCRSMADPSWKYLICPTGFNDLMALLRDKCEECDLRGYLNVLTETEEWDLTRAIVDAVGSLEDLTRGEFLELAKIAVDSGVIDVFSCKFCYKKVSSKKSLKRHMQIVHVHSEPSKSLPEPTFRRTLTKGIVIDTSFHCHLCPANPRFNFRRDLNHHLKVTHGENVQKQCTHCDKQFDTTSMLERHVLIHSKTRFDCKECSKTFSRKDELKRHGKTQHINRSYNIKAMLKDAQFKTGYKCRRCEKFLMDEYDMICHYEEKKCLNQCDMCEKTFKDKRYLNTHRLSHGPLPKFVCNICEKSFAFKTGLQKHTRKAHKDK